MEGNAALFKMKSNVMNLYGVKEYDFISDLKWYDKKEHRRGYAILKCAKCSYRCCCLLGADLLQSDAANERQRQRKISLIKANWKLKIPMLIAS